MNRRFGSHQSCAERTNFPSYLAPLVDDEIFAWLSPAFWSVPLTGQSTSHPFRPKLSVRGDTFL